MTAHYHTYNLLFHPRHSTIKVNNGCEKEKFGIAHIELMPLEELRKSMAHYGIRAEDNEFSRAIIEEHEK